MPKNHKNELIFLIRSLTKTEKGYFKKYAKTHFVAREKKFITLFDIIDRSDGNLSDHYLMRRGRMTYKQLVDTRYYLFGLILKSMQAYRSVNYVDAKIRNYLGGCEYLYEKGLYSSALKVVYKAEKLAEKYYKGAYLIEILAWERRLHATVNKFEAAKLSFEKREKIIRTLDQENTLGLLGARLNLFYIREHPVRSVYKKRDLAKYKKEMKFLDINKLSSIHAKHLYYNFVSLYADAENNFNKSYT
jgi:hypothetical protein